MAWIGALAAAASTESVAELRPKLIEPAVVPNSVLRPLGIEIRFAWRPSWAKNPWAWAT